MFFLSRWSGGLVARYGPKLPLIVGPLIAAAGFTMFAIPGIGGSYWKTFFPAFVVLGFGMAISVAPLTTVVMGTVDQAHAGAASGINNAVARIAGLLAIAVFGIVMVKAFAVHLDHQLAALQVSQHARNEIQSNRTKLAAIEIPADVDPESAEKARAAISNSFLFAFRIVAFGCAILSFASATAATLLIDGKPNKTKSPAEELPRNSRKQTLQSDHRVGRSVNPFAAHKTIGFRGIIFLVPEPINIL